MSQLLEILLIVDAVLLGIVLIFAMVRFCVVNKKSKNESVEENQTVEKVGEEMTTTDETPVVEEVTEEKREEVAEPTSRVDISEYLSDEDEIVIPRVKVMLVERSEVEEQPVEEKPEEAIETPSEEAPVVEEVTEQTGQEEVEEIEEPNEDNGLVDVVLLDEEEVPEDGEELVIGDTNKFVELKARVPFKEKLLGSEGKIQGYYDELYNKFISLRKMHARVSAKGVSFRLGRELVAKITYRGKTMKLHLALDVDAFDEKVYFQKDMSDVKAYQEVPFTVKVKSDRALKKAFELIDALIEKFEIEAKSRYERVDAIAELQAMD